MVQMKCGMCENDIEPERLEILPDTPFCSSCARLVKTPERRARLVFSHKTGGEIQSLPADVFESSRQYCEGREGQRVIKRFSRDDD